MQIIIVGAGLAGLSTALALTHSSSNHSILILESASQLAEVGAGVQLTPVATRQFLRWGLEKDLLAAAAIPTAWNLRRGEDGEVLNRVPMKELAMVYGGPYIVVHRADLHVILHKHCVKRGVEIRLKSRVKEYGFENGWVKLETGERLEADIVVACDGIESNARDLFLAQRGAVPKEGWLKKTGWAAYRTMVQVDDVKEDPVTAGVVAEHSGNCWAGANKSLMTYMVHGSDKLNLVFSHPDDLDTSKWAQEQYDNELKRLASDLDPCARKLMELSKGPITNWPIYQVRTLPTWKSNSGKFVLMGDGAHAMAFYLSMGVSLAVEDAAALVACLERYDSLPNWTLSDAITLFESVRKPRAEAVRDASFHAGVMLHLPPGKQRELRDAAARSDGADCAHPSDESEFGFLIGRNSYGITDRTIRDWCFGYDVVTDIESR